MTSAMITAALLFASLLAAAFIVWLIVKLEKINERTEARRDVKQHQKQNFNSR